MITLTDDPIEQAKVVYANEECRRNFEEDLVLHLLTPGCIVYKDNLSLALVRPVEKEFTYDELTDPTLVSDTPDCWWVYLLVGDFRYLTSLLPFELPWIGWERNNNPRFYRIQQLKRCTTFATKE